jgi:CDGSH-type Zn-finger protein
VSSVKKSVAVSIAKDGPYVVSGHAPLAEQRIVGDTKGESVEWREGEAYDAPEKYALCRCGQTNKPPFCDGSHARIGFDGTETAARTAYAEQAVVFDGPNLALLDARHLCADARFCDTHGKVWNQVAHTDDPKVRSMFLRQVHHCPAGRLIALDKATGKTIEQNQPVSIGLIEDPVQDCSGPIWLRGGVSLTSADGYRYEVRNNMTVCRCGASNNKPFCDGSHTIIKFSAKRKASSAE